MPSSTIPRDGFQPLQIPIDPSSVSPAIIPVLVEVSKKLEDSVSYWPGPSYPADLPATKFPDDDAEAPSLVKLFRESVPNIREDLKALAWDSVKGKPRHLDASQLDKLAETGTFNVPSKYPPHSHTWKVAKWLQKGRSPTHKSFERGLGKGLYHVVIGIPRRLFRNSWFSVRKGLSGVKRGGRRLVSLAVGWNETSPKYYASKIDEIVRDQENDYVKQQLEGSEEWMYDTRIFDNEMWNEHRTTLDTCRRHAMAKVEARAPEEWIRARKEAEQQQLSTDDSEKTKKKKNDVNVGRLLKRSALKESAMIIRANVTIPVGYAELWLELQHLELIVSEVEEDMLQEIDRRRNEIRQQLVDKHPILSTIPEWLEEQVEPLIDKECNNESYRMSWYEKVPDIAVAEGIGPLGAVYKNHILPFRWRQAPDLRRQLEQETKPARVFEVPIRIWRPKNWIKCENSLGSRHRYFPQKYRICHVSTDTKFWRLSLMFHESRSCFTHGLYVAWQALWNGTFGIKSLVYRHPFLSRYTMDPTTGEIVPDPASRTRTYCSRLAAVWDEVGRIRRDFEARPDTGLFGKPFARVLNVLSAYIGIGIPGTIIVLIGQPILTAIQVVLSSVAVVTSPIWGALSGLFVHGLCMTIYDFHHPHDNAWFPLLSIALWDFGLAGALQTGIALVMGLGVHPALAVLRIVLETIRREFRVLYDKLMWLLLLRRCRIPSQDSFIAWRVAGPGITADYCFQIRPDIAILVLMAKLEECELDLFCKDATNKINEPVVAYNEFFKDFEVFGLTVSSETMNLQKLRNLVKAQEEDLSKRVANRRHLYRQMTAFVPRDDDNGPRVRDAKLGRARQLEQDLDETLRKGTDVAADFCERLKGTYTDEEMSRFWFNAKVLPGDYGGLVKVLLERSFGETFWTPMEESDATIVIPIEHKTLESLIGDVMSSSEHLLVGPATYHTTRR